MNHKASRAAWVFGFASFTARCRHGQAVQALPAAPALAPTAVHVVQAERFVASS